MDHADAQLAYFDRLPAPVRRVIAKAHVEIHLDEDFIWQIKGAMQQGMTPDRVARYVDDLITSQRAEDALACYGPSHPEAQRARISL